MPPTVPVWVQAVQLTWRPVLRFFEERTHLLRELEDVGLLRAFAWEEADVLGARVDQYEFLELRSNGATLEVTSPRADCESGQMALELVLRRLEPKDVTLSGLTLRYLIPVDMDAGEVQRNSAVTLFPELVPESAGLDFAVLLDGESVRLKTPFQVEFGLLRPEEMVDRLSARIGRHSGGTDAPAAASVVDLDGLPACGAFFGWSWRFGERLEGDLVEDGVLRLWTGARDECEAFIRRIGERLGLAADGAGTARARG